MSGLAGYTSQQTDSKSFTASSYDFSNDATGFGTAIRNAGSVSNKGIELEIDSRVIDGKDFKWRLLFNIARNINRVESLGKAEYFFPSFEGVGTLTYLSPLIVKKGEPLGCFYGYKFVGIVQLDENISKLPPQTTETLSPGVARYEDVNQDGVVNEKDRIVLGNSQPKFTGGLTSTFSYRNFDLFTVWQGSYGNRLFCASGLRRQALRTTPSLR